MALHAGAALGRKGRKPVKDFFSEEKKQKTFISGVHQPGQIGEFGCRPKQLEFLVLFFKKELLAFLSSQMIALPGSFFFRKRRTFS
ncbi:MAG TPA: hypothetical protein VMB71_09945 [Acetobacteraceae bacterium]|nr:hypothetical protein [Acetobacteraceae bacterium]